MLSVTTTATKINKISRHNCQNPCLVITPIFCFHIYLTNGFGKAYTECPITDALPNLTTEFEEEKKKKKKKKKKSMLQSPKMFQSTCLHTTGPHPTNFSFIQTYIIQ